LKKKILIIGGTGFIGYHLALRCINLGWNVSSISTKKPKKIRYISKVKYLICDIANKKLLQNKINTNFDYVVNLGGYVDHSNKKKTYNSHYIGCKNLTSIFLRKKPIAFVQIGSCIEYGLKSSPQKEKITSKVKELKSIYGKAKLLATNHLLDLNRKKNFPSIILRLYLAYGPKQDANRFIPIIIKGCLENKKFPCSNGNQFRDFIHIKDVIRAIFKCLKNKNAIGQIINIGSGKPKKIKNIILLINRIVKKGYPQFGKIKLRKDEILKLYPNINKARKTINWSPKVQFNKGLENTISFYKKLYN
tara:strand:+ start:759 stop:1673 length:915 start_codon:yes stop_codon:yes gene_type:complete